MWKITLAALCAALGCIQPDLVLCAKGLACPAGDRCDDIHGACVVPDQLTVCAALADRADCTAGPISGGCFDGVCLPRGCGNRVVEAGEMCDDGNQISGDGCSGDCRSTERCGNGVVDPGEQCDDGNLVSRDGCDSRCQRETVAWRTTPIAPNLIDAHLTAFDAARGRLVYIGYRHTWEWDGARWTIAVTGTAAPAPVAVFYDPDRGQVDMIGSDGGPAFHVYTSSAGAWTQIDSAEGLPSDPDGNSVTSLVAAYDAVGHRLFAVEVHPRVFPLVAASDPVPGTTRAWSMDATGAWSRIADIPAQLFDLVAAYDPAAAQLVVVDNAGHEWHGDGASWETSDTGFGARVSLAVDPSRGTSGGGLVLVDGDSQTLYERVNAAWQAVPDSAVPCGAATADRPLYYNTASAALELFSSDSSMICTWSAGWTARIPALPFRPVGATYDPITHGLVVMHDARPSDPAAGIELWRLTDAGWERVATPHAPPGRASPLTAYSSGRAATVLYGGWTDAGQVFDAWAFDGVDWTPAAASVADNPDRIMRAMTYDASHRRVLLMIDNAWWGLGDDDDTWRPVELAPIDGYVSMFAWDARNATVLATGQLASQSPLCELGDQGCASLDLIPGDINPLSPTTVMSDPRSGGVLVFNLGTGAAWERLGSAWTRLPAVPVRDADQVVSAHNPVDGSVLYVASGSAGVIAAVMTRTSATPLESCQPGEDLDGDGLAGCDDPDCFWACARR